MHVRHDKDDARRSNGKTALGLAAIDARGHVIDLRLDRGQLAAHDGEGLGKFLTTHFELGQTLLQFNRFGLNERHFCGGVLIRLDGALPAGQRATMVTERY